MLMMRLFVLYTKLFIDISGDKVSRCRRGEVDPLTLDGILNETSRLSERSEMYFRFLRRRLEAGKYFSRSEANTPELIKLINILTTRFALHKLLREATNIMNRSIAINNSEQLIFMIFFIVNHFVLCKYHTKIYLFINMDFVISWKTIFLLSVADIR